MNNHPAYRFLMFVGTFAAILGGVFIVFKALALVGDAAESSSNQQAVISDNLVSPPTVPASARNIIIASTSVTTSANVQKKNNPKSIKPAVNEPVNDPAVAADISNSLNGFELSLADAVRSIPVSTAQASQPIVVATTTTTAATTTALPLQTQVIVVPPPAALPYVVDSFSDMTGWEREWGNASIVSNSLAIGATPSSTGGEAFLTDSDSWTNYMATVHLNWLSGQTFSLIARYNPGMNNVSCEFLRDGEVSVYRTLGGKRTLLGMGTISNFNPALLVTASIRVKNDHVQCGLDNGVVTDYLYYGMPQILLSGGFDIETWDPKPGQAQISIQSVSVEPLY